MHHGECAGGTVTYVWQGSNVTGIYLQLNAYKFTGKIHFIF